MVFSVEGERCHEIAINPAHLGQCRIIEVLQTLVHEMVHCWQFCFGKPGRGSYHNKEWANKMIHIGLQPTSTGFPGGNIVGQQMSDYPIDGGLFLQACEALIVNNTFSIPWIDRLQTPQSLIHDNSAQTTTDIICGHHVNVEDESESRVTTNQTSPDDLSIKELMTMTYSELLPEDTFDPWHKLLAQKANTSVPVAVIRYGESQRCILFVLIVIKPLWLVANS